MVARASGSATLYEAPPSPDTVSVSGPEFAARKSVSLCSVGAAPTLGPSVRWRLAGGAPGAPGGGGMPGGRIGIPPLPGGGGMPMGGIMPGGGGMPTGGAEFSIGCCDSMRAVAWAAACTALSWAGGGPVGGFAAGGRAPVGGLTVGGGGSTVGGAVGAAGGGGGNPAAAATGAACCCGGARGAGAGGAAATPTTGSALGAGRIGGATGAAPGCAGAPPDTPSHGCAAVVCCACLRTISSRTMAPISSAVEAKMSGRLDAKPMRFRATSSSLAFVEPFIFASILSFCSFHCGSMSEMRMCSAISLIRMRSPVMGEMTYSRLSAAAARSSGRR
mmetsp:Transcript_5801/g.22930  ORF Transcript_5801/g.22930 Transcript_5801/m.22930 type:complete len:332 (+) Transcript_5801:223-1218(+)